MWIKQNKKVEQQVTPTIQNLMQKYHIESKQAGTKRKRLECVSVGEKKCWDYKWGIERNN